MFGENIAARQPISILRSVEVLTLFTIAEGWRQPLRIVGTKSMP